MVPEGSLSPPKGNLLSPSTLEKPKCTPYMPSSPPVRLEPGCLCLGNGSSFAYETIDTCLLVKSQKELRERDKTERDKEN